VVECVRSTGDVLPPYIIFKGKQVQKAWLDPIKDGRTTLWVSDNGWTTNEIGCQWLEAFDRHTQPQSQGLHRLLLLDGHESHVSIDFIEYCQSHNIIALCLPPHSTHLTTSGCWNLWTLEQGLLRMTPLFSLETFEIWSQSNKPLSIWLVDSKPLSPRQTFQEGGVEPEMPCLPDISGRTKCSQDTWAWGRSGWCPAFFTSDLRRQLNHSLNQALHRRN